MRVAILETIVMPAGHEVEFDRILVDELKRQGHTPVFFVPEKFPFKLDYKCDIEYLDGGEVVTYAGANRLQKLFLSLKREQRRRAWFNSAYQKICEHKCDMLIIPTATYRYLKAIRDTNLKNSPVPISMIFHGINPHEKGNFVKQAKRTEKYANIKLKVITLRNDFAEDNLHNVDLIYPPVYKPMDFEPDKNLTSHTPLILGFYGQYRREKNIRFFLDAFKQAKFSVPVKLICQGATAMLEDSDEFEKIIVEYKDVAGIEFWHKNLIGKEWQQALLDCDVIVAPYAAERYRYHWSAMSFTAIGFYKPILQSPEMNPEVMEEFNVGEIVNLDCVENLSKQLENFVNNYANKVKDYCIDLARANEKYSHEKLIQSVLN